MGKADRDNDRDSPGRGGRSSGSSGGRGGKSPQDHGTTQDNDAGFASGLGAGFANDQQAAENNNNRASGGIGGKGGGYLDSKDDPEGGWGKGYGTDFDAYNKYGDIKDQGEDNDAGFGSGTGAYAESDEQHDENQRQHDVSNRDGIGGWYDRNIKGMGSPDNLDDNYGTELGAYARRGALSEYNLNQIDKYSKESGWATAIQAFTGIATLAGGAMLGPAGLLGGALLNAGVRSYLSRDQEEGESFASYRARKESVNTDGGLISTIANRGMPGLGVVTDAAARAQLNPNPGKAQPDRDMGNNTSERTTSRVSASNQISLDDLTKLFEQMAQDQPKQTQIARYDPSRIGYRPPRRR